MQIRIVGQPSSFPTQFCARTPRWNKSSIRELVRFNRGNAMQSAIERVMQTYGMLVNLTKEQEQAAREKVSKFLAETKIDDENKLAVEGLKYLRAK